MSNNPLSQWPAAAGTRDGILFVISAPSGAGKTSLCKEIVDLFPGLRHSVSYTTRPMRPGEVEGRDYFFVDRTVFDAMVAAGEFAEWAEVHGNRYGTALATLEAAREAGDDLLLDIDCQGAAQLKRSYSQGVYIFILPPSLTELERRLRCRNTDGEEVIARRLANARGEIAAAAWYDYLIINDDFRAALDQFRAVLIAEGIRAERGRGFLANLLQS